MAKHRTAPSPEPAPSQDPVLETAPTAPASPLPEPPDQDVIIEPPLSQIPVPELTGPQCEAELARLGDPIARRKADWASVQSAIDQRRATLEKLDRKIALLQDDHRRLLERTQQEAERVRQIVSVRLPQLLAAQPADTTTDQGETVQDTIGDAAAPLSQP